MARVLVTGGTGFIGRHCVAELLRSGHEIHIVSRQARLLESGPVHWHRLSLFDDVDVSRLIEQVKPDALLHLAWEARPGQFWESGENVRWVESTLSLIRRFAGVGGGRIVVAGTCVEYSWTNGGTLDEVTTSLAPKPVYGKCKAALFSIVDSIAEQWGLSLAWGRVFFLYGPGEPRERLVPSVVLSLINGDVAHCTHGNQIRDYMYVGDVARAFVELFESDLVGAVNIGSGVPISVREVVEEIGRQTGRPDLIAFGSLPERAGDPPVIVAGVRRLNNELNFVPRVSLATGLERTVSWFRDSVERQR